MPGKFNSWPIVLALAASLLIGFTISTLAYRYRYLRVPGQGVAAQMNRDLHLTPGQREQIVGIMQDTRLRVKQVRNHFQRARRTLLMEAYAQIRATLTPEQQQQFDREFAMPSIRAGAGAAPQAFASPADQPSAAASSAEP
ncbi:MAG: hypothetical protein WAU33_04150 [Candidatus Binataceae bacterium]